MEKTIRHKAATLHCDPFESTKGGFIAHCVVQFQEGTGEYEQRLEGPHFPTKEEAIEYGAGMGVHWVDENLSRKCPPNP